MALKKFGFLFAVFFGMISCETHQKGKIVTNSNSTISNSKFTLTTLEGSVASVFVITDYLNNRIVIKAENYDSVSFQNFTALLGSVNMINGKFLSIKFALRGGSGFKLNRYVEFCISNNKIHTAINLFSLKESEIIQPGEDDTDRDSHTTTYTISNKLEVENITTSLPEFERLISERVLNGKRIIEEDKVKVVDTFRLKFHKSKKVFYNKEQQLSGNIRLINKKGFSNNRRFENESCLMIMLNDERYYFIDDLWFYKNETGDLVEIST